MRAQHAFELRATIRRIAFADRSFRSSVHRCTLHIFQCRTRASASAASPRCSPPYESPKPSATCSRSLRVLNTCLPRCGESSGHGHRSSSSVASSHHHSIGLAHRHKRQRRPRISPRECRLDVLLDRLAPHRHKTPLYSDASAAEASVSAGRVPPLQRLESQMSPSSLTSIPMTTSLLDAHLTIAARSTPGLRPVRGSAARARCTACPRGHARHLRQLVQLRLQLCSTVASTSRTSK